LATITVCGRVDDIDSFEVQNDNVVWRDGSAALELVGGATPPIGSTAQVGVLSKQSLLVTLKTDPLPGTVDIVPLRNGAVTGAAPMPCRHPRDAHTVRIFVYPDGTAVITLAHSNQNGLFETARSRRLLPQARALRAGRQESEIRLHVNAASKTISRLIGTGSNVFVDTSVAAQIPGGGPTESMRIRASWA